MPYRGTEPTGSKADICLQASPTLSVMCGLPAGPVGQREAKAAIYLPSLFSIGNVEAKELICMTHGHELRWGMLVGGEGAGWRGIERGKMGQL